MKKINAFLVISIILCSILVPLSFTENVSAIDIEQHEVANGTTYGRIHINITENPLYEKYITTRIQETQNVPPISQ
ncbi:unnamed protein product [marine sediment metagenome]|uniref:Uncharacterized protein n=1 Tax=marine sediment metagenome TaxID=412755 RepID=X1BIF2_9ZZZZ